MPPASRSLDSASRGDRAPALIALRHLALALAALALPVAVGASACRGIIVADEENYEDVAVHMCACSGDLPLGDRDDCESKVSERLSGVGSETRARWLTKYVNECADKGCGAVMSCYHTVPVCSSGECERDVECCSYDGGAGACSSGYCVPP